MNKEIESVINNEKTIETFLYLYERWEDEKYYEDFEDYTNALMKHMPKNAVLIEGTETPFGVKFLYGTKKYHIFLKLYETYCTLAVSMA